jgi:predicted transcriptional regulator
MERTVRRTSRVRSNGRNFGDGDEQKELAKRSLQQKTERTLLGACLKDEIAAAHAWENLEPDDFTSREYRNIFDAIGTLTKRRTVPDVLNVANELASNGFTDASYGFWELDKLRDECRDPNAAFGYVETLIAEWAKREQLLAYHRGVSGIWTPEQVARRLEELVARTKETETAPRKFRLQSGDELSTTPPLRWKLRPFVIESGYHIWFGLPSSGKTTIILHIALTLALRGDNVLWIATENVPGLANKYNAWRATHPNADIGTRFQRLVLPNGLNLADRQDTDEILAIVREENVTLVVLDTLRESYTGDENSSDEAARNNRFAARLTALGCAVIYVTHPGRNGDHLRGSSAYEGNADFIARVTHDDLTRIARVTPTKDRTEEYRELTFLLVPTDIGLANDDGSTRLVGVAQLRSDTNESAALFRTHLPNETETVILRVLDTPALFDGASFSELLDATNVEKGTLAPALRELVEKGLWVIQPAGRRTKYVLTDEGRNLIAALV